MSKDQIITVGRSLVSKFSEVDDPRIDRTKDHELVDIIVITVLGTIVGANNWVEIVDWATEDREWLSEFLSLKNGIPSHDTFGRVFSLIKPEQFQKAFRDWVDIIRECSPKRDIIAIDGKFLKGALAEAGRPRSAIIMVSAWSNESGISLAQMTCRLKKEQGEKRVTEKLLDCINIDNQIVTLDANGTTTRIFEKVIEGKGDIVVGFKTNQKALLNLVQNIFECGKNSGITLSHIEKDNNHGRKETRAYELISFENAQTDSMDASKKKQLKKWKYLKGVGRVTSERINKLTGVIQTETRYFILSFSSNINEFAKAVRQHWGIENKLHWQLDVTFREDHSRARIGHSAENLAVVRHMALNMIKQEKSIHRSISRKRFLCLMRKDYLLKVLFGQSAKII